MLYTQTPQIIIYIRVYGPPIGLFHLKKLIRRLRWMGTTLQLFARLRGTRLSFMNTSVQMDDFPHLCLMVRMPEGEESYETRGSVVPTMPGDSACTLLLPVDDRSPLWGRKCRKWVSQRHLGGHCGSVLMITATWKITFEQEV